MVETKAAATEKAAAASAKATATANDDSGESTIEPWLTGSIVETLLVSCHVQFTIALFSASFEQRYELVAYVTRNPSRNPKGP